MHRLPRAFRLRQQHFVAPRLLNRLAQRRITSQSGYTLKNGEPVRFQAVRFKKPGLTPRRLAIFGLYASTTFLIIKATFRFLNIDIVIESLDEMEEEDAAAAKNGEHADEEGEEESEYAEEDSLFIPMTWATKLPREFYKGSDPEWQEFIKVAKDKPRQKKIRDELVNSLFTSAVKHPSVKTALGAEPKIGHHWLDITFPDGPPQDFERSGIEIGDGFVAWSRQRISADAQWRTMRALWPQAAFGSIWATTKVLAGINYRRAKEALGFEVKDPLSGHRQAIELIQKQRQAQERKQVGKTQAEPDGNPGAVVGSSSDSQSPVGDGKKLPWYQPRVPLIPGAATSSPTDVPIAMSVFTSTLRKKWTPSKIEPPKGSFVVQGLVEFRGKTGTMIFDLTSCYDPKQCKCVVMRANMRTYKKRNQAPRGGP